MRKRPAARAADLPTQCDWGVKRNSKGVRETWRGYKLHVAVSDGDVPTAMIVTSASVHDSQVAIPLMQRTRESCTMLYDLLDDEHGGRTVRVRGHAKVALHLAFGVLVIAVEQAFRLLE